MEMATDKEKLAQALIDIAVLTERIKNRDEELDLQAKEYERRLTDLNHAHALAEEKNSEYLPRVMHDKFYAEYQEWRRAADLDLTSLKTRRDSNVALFSAVISVLSIVLWGVSIWGGLK